MKKWMDTEQFPFDVMILVGTNLVRNKLNRARLFLDDASDS